MESVELYLPNINFKVRTLKLYKKDIIKAINDSIIPYKKDSDKYIEIEYMVNKNKYLTLVSKIKSQKGIIYDSFKNQTHKEVLIEDNLYYLVDNEQYICEKVNDYNYKVIVAENNWNSLNWVIRIIRELYLREKEDRKYYFMHGTALEFNNKGILLLGASGSGKTTLAVKMLELEEYKRFLSNDRVLIDKNKNLEYFPHAVTYAMGTVKNNEDLDKYFRENRILEKKRKIKYEDAPYDMDCNTPLNDIEKVFQHTGMIAKTTLDIIIYPRFKKKMDNLEIIEMEDEEKIKLLEETNFTPNDMESLRKPWLRKRVLDENEILVERKELVRELLTNVKIIKINFGIKSNVKEILNLL